MMKTKYWRKSNFGQIRLTDTKIYEVSDWFRNIIQRLKKTKRRIDLQKKWFDIAHQYMLHNNLIVLNSTFDAFSLMKDRVYRKKLWRYFYLSIVYQERMKKIQKFAKHLRDYNIQKNRERWVYLSSKIVQKKNKKVFQEAYFSYTSSLKKWMSLINRITRQSNLKDFNQAHKELQKQRQLKLNMLNNQKSNSLRASYRRDWISLACRISRQNKFQSMLGFSNDTPATEDYENKNVQASIPTITFSSTKTQTVLPNKESIPYKNFMKMLRNYYIQRFYTTLDELHSQFREKQRQKRIKRRQKAKTNWRRFVKNYRKLCQTDELEYSYQQLQRFKNRWIHFRQELYLNNLHLLCEEGLRYLDAKYLRVSQKWKEMIIRTLLNYKKTIVEDHLQKYRQEQFEKATNFGTDFLFNSNQKIAKNVPEINDFVKTHYSFNMLHYQKTIPIDFWHDASYFAFSFTHRCLYESANLAVPLLTERSTPLAEAFADCQGILTATDQSNRNRIEYEEREKEIKKKQNKQKNVHIIVGFGFDDKVSILESVGD